MAERRNAAGKRMAETATDRLSRMLAMVPWIIANPGRLIEEVAAEFAITPEQLDKDLNLLWLCGTPGYSHLELIDADWDSGRVWIRNADEIARPMRLTRDEAVALTAGLQALRATAVEGDERGDVVERTIAKLRRAVLGEGGIEVMDLDIDRPTQHAAYEPLREALRGNRRVHLRYYVETRDEMTERDVDPMGVLNLDGAWYLEGWCHRAEDVRLFRLDRIDAAHVLPVDGTPPPQAVPRDREAPLFVGSDTDLVVTLEADPEAAWVCDYYPNDEVVRETGEDGRAGTTRITMRVADRRLVERLVLRQGGALRVTSPADLASAVSGEATRALRGYPDVHGAVIRTDDAQD